MTVMTQQTASDPRPAPAPEAAAPEVDLGSVNLFDPALHADGDPHRIWAHMRRAAPLHRQTLPDGRGFASVTRYQDVRRVLSDSRAFTSERGSLLDQLGHGDEAAGQMMVSTDPPDHAALRRPLQHALQRTALEAARPRIRAAARAVLAPAAAGEPFDLVTSALDFPMMFTGALMGIPERDWPDLVRWTSMAASPEDPGFKVGSRHATLAIAHHELFSYFTEQTAARPDGSGDLLDLLAGLGTRAKTVYNCYSLLLGANATTPHAFTGTVLALLEHPDQLAEARRHPELVPSLVEEGLRWTSPASSFLRHAVEDVELEGGLLRKGEAVAAWVGSANRDETVFADAARFDLRRTKNRHITFGVGAHYCLGAILARLALNELLTELLGRLEHIEPAGPVRRLRSNFIAGLGSMPVAMTLRPPGPAA